MRVSKDDIPTRIDAPGAVARQLPDFGVAGGSIGAEYFSMAAGTDLAPLLVGLEGDLCQSAHWGYVLEGDLVVTYSDGGTERCRTGDVFHWPAGHSVRVEVDAELILFSPQDDHGPVIDHIHAQVSGG
ncbi:MAG: cupin domain-containing protein [Acidimicrobiales bacterium]